MASDSFVCNTNYINFMIITIIIIIIINKVKVQFTLEQATKA
jgi:hypothetical protein